jgi:lipopolysaccharide transport system ATP-binding protein
MSNTVIKVENLSKQYRLGNVGTGSLAHDVNRAWHRIRGNEDPYLIIGEENERTKKGGSDYVWALKDINFEVQHGEVLGIIGRNGAGKSTLLKILSRTTSPTTGSVKIKGRVASLLEVGTGFHPELSGRENIFLNGAILGMTKKEIKIKFDEIVDFAGVERYIDTPVKRYSSGMYVRLAFGVAAHLDSEILIVDEVLAVGDAEFQKKCLGKMGEISKGEGRTVLFVSHNMAAIQQLCNHLVYLKNGEIDYKGSVMEGLKIYYNSIKSINKAKEFILKGRDNKNKKAFITGFDIKMINDSKNLFISIFVEAAAVVEKVEIAVGINDGLGIRLATFHSRYTNQLFNLEKGMNELTCVVDHFFLKQDNYNMNIFLGNRYETIDFVDEAIDFEIPEYNFYEAGIIPDNSQGYLMAHHNWEIK